MIIAEPALLVQIALQISVDLWQLVSGHFMLGISQHHDL